MYKITTTLPAPPACGFHIGSYSSHYSLSSCRIAAGSSHVTSAHMPRFIRMVGPDVRRIYKAAGVFVLAKDPNTNRLMMLIGREDRTKRVGRHQTPLGHFWLHFQGKRDQEDDDNPCQTAFRELEEETGGILKPFHDSIHQQIFDETRTKIWYRNNKYVLFVVSIPFDSSLPLRFASLDRTRCKDMYQNSLRWIAVDSLYKMTQRREHRHLQMDEPLYPFFCMLLRVPGVRKLMQKITAGEALFACDVLPWRLKSDKDSISNKNNDDCETPAN